MTPESGTVWVGLRADGVEIARVKATCAEISRSNGVAKFETLGKILFGDLPCDFTEPLITLSDSEHATPFGAARMNEYWLTFHAGQNIGLTSVKFERVLDVPRYVKPARKPRRRLIRLGI